MVSVLITTSGTGDRLGLLTKYTNKSLVPVGNKYAICYIIENYPIDTEFIITLGYYGNLVRQFLQIAYPQHRFIFVDIDNFVGPGSSLGYSLLQAKKYLQKPFIFHCCDAVITRPVFYVSFLSFLNVNYLCVYKSEDNLSYASVVMDTDIDMEKRGRGRERGVIKEINCKGHSVFDYIYTGISYIHDYALFWKYLEIKFQENSLNSSLSDVDSLCLMLNEKEQKCIFKTIVLEEGEWYDTGNMNSYQKIQDAFPSSYSILSKPNESICFMDFQYESHYDNRVIKFNHDKVLNQKRVKRAEILGSGSGSSVVPNILDSSEHFMCMEKIEGVVLSDYYVHGEVGRLLNWALKYLWKFRSQNVEKYPEMCRRFYLNKTLDRIHCNSFLGSGAMDYSMINGIKMPNIFSLMQTLENEYSSILMTDTFYSFHGDFILDNIIKTKESYVLIDWRHEFDSELSYGDIYYDLAKLRHNLFLNHKNINDGLFTIRFYKDAELDLESIEIDMKCNYFLVQQLADYNCFIQENGFDMNKICVITALVWLNMSSLYEGSFGKFLFYFGKYHLFLSLRELGVI